MSSNESPGPIDQGTINSAAEPETNNSRPSNNSEISSDNSNFGFCPDGTLISLNDPETEILCPGRFFTTETDSVNPFKQSEREQFNVASYSSLSYQVEVPETTEPAVVDSIVISQIIQNLVVDAGQIQSERQQNQIELQISPLDFDSASTRVNEENLSEEHTAVARTLILPEDSANGVIRELSSPEDGALKELIVQEESVGVELGLPKYGNVEERISQKNEIVRESAIFEGGTVEDLILRKDVATSEFELREDKTLGDLCDNSTQNSSVPELQDYQESANLDDSDNLEEILPVPGSQNRNDSPDRSKSKVDVKHVIGKYFGSIFGSDEEYSSALEELEMALSDSGEDENNLDDGQVTKSSTSAHMYFEFESGSSVVPTNSQTTSASKSDVPEFMKVDLTDLPTDESESEWMDPAYRMDYYPFWLRSDGQNTLLATANNLVAQKFVTHKDKPFYRIELPIRNISARTVTFLIRTCDVTRYDVEPMIGILEREQKVSIEITTRSPGEWAYVDLQHYSIQVLVSTFTTTGDLGFCNEKTKSKRRLTAAAKLWKTHGTPNFPYAEQHVIRHMIPYDPAYLDEPSLNRTACDRFRQRYWVNSRFFGGQSAGSSNLTNRPDMDMMFGEFSEDPGDLFLRDQLRSLVLNKERMHQFSSGQQQSLTKLAIVIAVCILGCIILWILR